ncbi:hypothetical protein PV11_09317 [Exophiala sideris]|uniref:Uncharacterized protein n=1 Tax=Exophiala sideris TaxID=1016849 RepID=A0A0D1Y414_9EURO|nr:hypothetical protein PV11_09317 [Exophiala sideris]
MSLRKSARLSATPSRLFTDRADNKAPASSNSSNEPSPTFSNGDSFNSNGPSTSVTDWADLDDHAYRSTQHSSATMRSKPTTRRDSQSNTENGSRRSSGRLRKSTAKEPSPSPSLDMDDIDDYSYQSIRDNANASSPNTVTRHGLVSRMEDDARKALGPPWKPAPQNPSTSTIDMTDVDDYTYRTLRDRASSATEAKSTTRRDSQSNAEHESRRSSGRVRKPTAKAQALNGSRSYSPPLSDTIVIGSSSQKEDSPVPEQAPPAAVQPTDTAQKTPPAPEIPETPATSKVNGTVTPSKTPIENDETLLTTVESPSRRASRRERKPTAKVLEISSSAQKRPATEEEDVRPRKSARISHSGARVPSKLRYSLSSATEEDVMIDDDKVEIGETPKKSKMIVLKSKRLSEVNDPSQSPVVEKPQPPSSRRESKRKVRVDEPSKENTVIVPPARAANIRPIIDLKNTCNLSCLEPSSRLLAFAEIARQMPDAEVDDTEVMPGSVHDWRAYTGQWCECNKVQPAVAAPIDSEELARALLPNTVAGSSKYEPIDLTESQPQATPEAELLSTPVNTILRASDAERLSLLYAAPPVDAESRDRNSLSAGPSVLRELSFSAPQARPSGPRHQMNTMMYPPPTSSTPLPARNSYEERIRRDHENLTSIRQRAAAKRIQWTFNMTFDEIQALILEHEAAGERLYLDSYIPVDERERRMSRGQQPGTTRRQSDAQSGFGMLMLPPGYPHSRPAGKSRQTESANVNGISNVSHAHGSPPTNGLPKTQDSLRPNKYPDLRPDENLLEYIDRLVDSLPSPDPKATSKDQMTAQEKEALYDHIDRLVDSMPGPADSRRQQSPSDHTSTSETRATKQTIKPPISLQAGQSDFTGSQYRRASSPSRPKSSRFRVDPRGLRGESPGPGTIINMAEKRNASGKQTRRSRGKVMDGGERA